MKASQSVLKNLATQAGVPAGLAVQAQDWDLSSAADLDASVESIAKSLPEDAVAYLEYCSYPGFRFEEILRNIVGYHCRDIHDVKERREQSLAILRFVATCGQAEWIREFMTGELDRLQGLKLEQFDAQFDPSTRGFRNSDLAAVFDKHQLRCWFEPQTLQAHTLQARSYVFVAHRTVEAQEEQTWAPSEPNALYHEMVYPQYLHAGLHPERLETMAKVFGLTPKPAEECRVLELGCGQGITMLNSASDLMRSEFVGVDFSQIQIDEANAAAKRLGLSNTQFLAMDIAEFDPSLGQFDYIVAHGMYSWIPEPIRQKMLAICRDHLADHGIAYISFNANPGYQFPGMIRDVGLDSVSGKVRELPDAALAFDRMKQFSIAPGVSEPRRKILKPCMEHFSKAVLQSATFDELADINTPFLFDEFASESRQFGLQFFAEGDIKTWSTQTLHPNAQQLLDGLLDDPARRIQYRDLLCFTRFHASLLCRAERKPSASPLPGLLERMLLTMRGYPNSPNPDVRGDGEELFIGPLGVEVKIGDPLLKAALVTLYLEHPVRYTFEKLLKEASELADVPPDAARLRRWLQPLWETGFLEIHSHMPAIVLEPGDKPVGHHLARICAEEMPKVPSLLGVGVEVADEVERELLQRLDGSRDLTDLERELGLSPDDLQSRLKALARLGLLVA